MPSEPLPPSAHTLMLTQWEVGQTLRLGRRKVWEMCNSGELPIVRVGRRILIPRADLERWIEAKTQGGGR
jgi:excisionase family DNA binding protein